MDSLKSYLDYVFSSIPQSDAAARAKQDLLDMMTDHYHEELAKGKSETDAVASAIASLGSVDELRATLDTLGNDQSQASASPTSDFDEETGDFTNTTSTDSKIDSDTSNGAFNPEDAEAYWAKSERFARMLSIGIALTIAAMGLAIMADYTRSNWFFNMLGIDPDGLVAMVLLGGWAVGVALIVRAGLNRRGDNEWLYEHWPIANATFKAALARRDSYHNAYTTGLTGGIVMCILSIAAPAMDGSDAGAGLFFLFVAIGVYFIVYVGLVNSSFKRVLEAAKRPYI
ncbi:permease prefix domain 1-containing protein [Lacticaseibacillus yichunensis]|uniref:Permease prefix domain 1-containing protein n=1 Tax=Lacticaseibacillus yichunensis TaxID=2486015 RepID=A0ABW4CN12_9LACO|nr:permease prefix domain 1-containing protein [Lacticaseibacillus yichunensis]